MAAVKRRIFFVVDDVFVIADVPSAGFVFTPQSCRRRNGANVRLAVVDNQAATMKWG